MSRRADAEPLADRIIVESLGDELHDFAFSDRELVERRPFKCCGPGRRCRQKIVECLDKLPPCRFGLQLHMVAAFERYEPRARYRYESTD
jgi:hypothetical protein